MPELDRGTGRASPWPTHVATLVVTSLVILVLLLPGDSAGSLTGKLPWGLPDHADKWIHALLFFIETRFLVRSCRHLRRGLPPLTTAIAAAVILGALTEIAQLWVPHRSGDFVDWIADLSGAAAYGIWYRRLGRREEE